MFPDEVGDDSEKALESTLTGGGIAEVFEDDFEAHHPKVTPLRRPPRPATDQVGDSSDPKVSKTS